MQYYFQDNDHIKIEFVFKDDLDELFFTGEKGEIYPKIEDKKILLGLGEKKDFDLDILQEAVYKLGKVIMDKKIKNLSFEENKFDISDRDYVLRIVEAVANSSYNFNYYKEEQKPHPVDGWYFPSVYEQYADDSQELLTVLKSQYIARDLVNIRANEMTPEILTTRAQEILADEDVNVKIYEIDEIEELGLTAFLTVAKGSQNEPRLIVLEYLKGGDEKPLVYVGKGLAYDSGGYSIKPTSGMDTMHCDMAGAATVIGAMRAIARNDLKVNVVGIIATCENMISGGAYKPGDIITARNGLKIEVDNTDAEGRITLADAVNYGVDTYEPKLLVDLATLTGAVLLALGETYTGVVTNDRDALAQVQEAADKSNEKIWELPNDPYFKKYFKSDIADIKNSGKRLSGSITAGQFIECFVEDTPWVHLDIAGTAYLSEQQFIYDKGATGIHVKTLYQLAKDNQ